MGSGAAHRWDVTPREAARLQARLARRVRATGPRRRVRLVAGADVGVDEATSTGYAGVILYSFPGLQEIERRSARRRLRFPYVPGLLSFREGPILLEAIRALSRRPDVILFDGQGLAHPRRFGLASHLGVVLGIPSIGCAKSLLVGTHAPPGPLRGSWAAIVDRGERVGAALRTRTRVKPVYVSVGHMISMKRAMALTLACGDGYRIPRPTREADRWVRLLRLAGTRRS
jgi:deoxyribonuclease V